MALNFKALRKDLAQQAVESSAGEVRKEVVGDKSPIGQFTCVPHFSRSASKRELLKAISLARPQFIATLCPMGV